MGRQFDVHAHAVGQRADGLNQPGVRAGDGLGVDVSAKAVFLAQQPQRGEHAFAGVIRVLHHGGAQKQALDVIALVEFDGQLRQFARGERGARNVVFPAVDAIAAIVGAGVAHQHLEKRYAAPIRGEAVANAACHCAAQAARLPLAIQPAGSAGNIVFRRVRQNAQLIHEHGGIWHAKDLLSTQIEHMFYSVL